MQPLFDQQAQFAAALLGPVQEIPSGWVGPDGRPDARRFGVYRNNVASSLIEALREAYPAVHRLLGGEYFDALSKIFIQAHPPQSPVMLDYGAAFPAFVARFEPLAGLPYLPDVACIERAWLEAYHSRDAAAVSLEALTHTLSATSPERAGALRVALHPSVRVVRSQWPSLTIWQMNVGARSMEQLDLHSGGEDTLLSRPQAQVCVRAMSSGEAALIERLQAGESLGEAAQHAVECDGGFDLGVYLAGAFSEGLMVRVWLPDEPVTVSSGPW